MNFFQKRNIAAIWADMYNSVRRYMSCNVGYFGYPSINWHNFGQKKETMNRKLFSYDVYPYSSGLKLSTVDIGRQYFKEHLKNDPMVREVYKVESGHIITSSQFSNYPEYQPIEQFFKEWDIGFRILIPLPSPSSQWFPVLNASSPLSAKEGERMLAPSAHHLVERLIKLNQEMMLHYADRFNPFLTHNVISEKALRVMELTSYGYNNREVAEKIGLTEDGVKYHIKNMKVLLGARNIAHLVALTKDMKLI